MLEIFCRDPQGFLGVTFSHQVEPKIAKAETVDKRQKAGVAVPPSGTAGH
jgi:hypothetical protein